MVDDDDASEKERIQKRDVFLSKEAFEMDRIKMGTKETKIFSNIVFLLANITEDNKIISCTFNMNSDHVSDVFEKNECKEECIVRKNNHNINPYGNGCKIDVTTEYFQEDDVTNKEELLSGLELIFKSKEEKKQDPNKLVVDRFVEKG